MSALSIFWPWSQVLGLECLGLCLEHKVLEKITVFSSEVDQVFDL